MINRCKEQIIAGDFSLFKLYVYLVLHLGTLGTIIFAIYTMFFGPNFIEDDDDDVSVDGFSEWLNLVVTWFIFICFTLYSCIFLPWAVYGYRKHLKKLRQTLKDVERRSQVSGPSAFRRSRLDDHGTDAMEEADYTLCGDNDVPTAKEVVGASACGSGFGSTYPYVNYLAWFVIVRRKSLHTYSHIVTSQQRGKRAFQRQSFRL